MQLFISERIFRIGPAILAITDYKHTVLTTHEKVGQNQVRRAAARCRRRQLVTHTARRGARAESTDCPPQLNRKAVNSALTNEFLTQFFLNHHIHLPRTKCANDGSASDRMPKINVFAHQRAASQTSGLDWLVCNLVLHRFYEDSSQYDSDGINRFVVERQIRGSAVGCMLHVNACCSAVFADLTTNLKRTVCELVASAAPGRVRYELTASTSSGGAAHLVVLFEQTSAPRDFARLFVNMITYY
ncbi:hypothetical protein EVAR_16837_1 [Eumeta japonica]|uniref:Uncharacterized protein n=1 Tax=Eumeta variegata TaxID=151549 RepID=A0A4C1V377_EUMVA|nr:hypothetical protein EVAR_16837_1 [Eumeta japonica]